MEWGLILRCSSFGPLRMASGCSTRRPRTLLRFLTIRHWTERSRTVSDQRPARHRQSLSTRSAPAGRRQRGRGRSLQTATGAGAARAPTGQRIQRDPSPPEMVPQNQRSQRRGEMGIFGYLLGRSQPVFIHWNEHRTSVVVDTRRRRKKTKKNIAPGFTPNWAFLELKKQTKMRLLFPSFGKKKEPKQLLSMYPSLPPPPSFLVICVL